LKEIEGIYICQAENTRHGLRVTKAFRISVFGADHFTYL